MEEKRDLAKVQAFISCVSFPTTIDEVLDLAENDDSFTVEIILDAGNYEYLEWTVPKWARKGDIVLFYHAKTGNVKISNLRRQLREDEEYSDDQKELISVWIEKAKQLFKETGGRILAVGRLSTDPYYVSSSEFDNPGVVHYNMNMWAQIEDVWVFDDPIHINEMSEYITIVRQASITPLFGEAYERLKEAIWEVNDVPEYYADSESVALPLYEIDSTNWLKVSMENGRKFRFESQFRSFYVDYLLKDICDTSEIYRECPCLQNESVHPAYVDNVIIIGGRYLPVEVKLNIAIEKDIIGQIRNYCSLSKLFLNSNSNHLAPMDKVVGNRVMIIDEIAIYMYDDEKHEVKEIIQLDEIKNKTDLQELRSVILKLM